MYRKKSFLNALSKKIIIHKKMMNSTEVIQYINLTNKKTPCIMLKIVEFSANEFLLKVYRNESKILIKKNRKRI